MRISSFTGLHFRHSQIEILTMWCNYLFCLNYSRLNAINEFRHHNTYIHVSKAYVYTLIYINDTMIALKEIGKCYQLTSLWIPGTYRFIRVNTNSHVQQILFSLLFFSNKGQYDKLRMISQFSFWQNFSSYFCQW